MICYKKNRICCPVFVCINEVTQRMRESMAKLRPSQRVWLKKGWEVFRCSHPSSFFSATDFWIFHYEVFWSRQRGWPCQRAVRWNLLIPYSSSRCAIPLKKENVVKATLEETSVTDWVKEGSRATETKPRCLFWAFNKKRKKLKTICGVTRITGWASSVTRLVFCANFLNVSATKRWVVLVRSFVAFLFAQWNASETNRLWEWSPTRFMLTNGCLILLLRIKPLQNGVNSSPEMFSANKRKHFPRRHHYSFSLKYKAIQEKCFHWKRQVPYPLIFTPVNVLLCRRLGFKSTSHKPPTSWWNCESRNRYRSFPKLANEKILTKNRRIKPWARHKPCNPVS